MLPVVIAAFLYGVWNVLTNIVAQNFHFIHPSLFTYVAYFAIHVGGYSFDARFLLDTLLFLVLLFTVMRQQFAERQRQSQIEMELKSAREVQHVLIPEESPSIPGLLIATVYKPATEVGGDFFQIIPLPASDTTRGAIIILGDVSGKGLKAAMTVSFIVGTIRTLAVYTDQPAEILRGLNQRLIGRMERGFATCLAMRITADGVVTLANAGHLPPYLDDKELPVPGSLPLGLFADASYEAIHFHLQEAEALTLYTDGIVEARNAQGELFGFERTAHLLSTQPSVQQVADTAVHFGQEDDITILSIRRVTEAESHASTVSLTYGTATVSTSR
jgi:serine phosphatase RsbU (regulator of sigma subunit)